MVPSWGCLIFISISTVLTRLSLISAAGPMLQQSNILPAMSMRRTGEGLTSFLRGLPRSSVIMIWSSVQTWTNFWLWIPVLGCLFRNFFLPGAQNFLQFRGLAWMSARSLALRGLLMLRCRFCPSGALPGSPPATARRAYFSGLLPGGLDSIARAEATSILSRICICSISDVWIWNVSRRRWVMRTLLLQGGHIIWKNGPGPSGLSPGGRPGTGIEP